MTNIIVPVPKKGDLSKYDNYRGISLMSIVGKVYNRILLNRLQPFVDPLLDNSQNGFRRGRAATGHILAIRRIIEEYQRHSKQGILTFIDFKKAFDSTNRSRMKKTLKLYGIPDKVVEQIHCMYLGSRCEWTASYHPPSL